MRHAVRAVITYFSPDPLQRSAVLSCALLMGWVVLAAVLRLNHLLLKPLWTDEFSTLVFGLGHSFTTLPLNRILDEATLLSPVLLTPATSVWDAARQLLSESNHPPLYFMLTHGWVHLFPSSDGSSNGYVSIWAARSLSVLFGVMTVPAMYGAGWIAFRSRAIAHLAAALMAVSPFGIYLAQDARHYTLTLVWIVGSLACLFQASQQYIVRKPLSLMFVLGWIGINALGMASHYFFVMTLVAEAIALSVLILSDRRQSKSFYPRGLQQLGAVSLGTAASMLVWVPYLLGIRQGDALTRWLEADSWNDGAWVNPLLHTLGGIVSMVMLFPIQNVDDATIVASAIGVAICTSILGWFVWKGLRMRLSSQVHRIPVMLLLAFIGGAIALLLLATYALGIEMAQVFRYHFFYFPGILLLIAAGLSPENDATTPHSSNVPGRVYSPLSSNLGHGSNLRRGMIILLIALGCVGALTVTHDLGYRKLHRPDRIVEEIHEKSEHPVLITIAHQTHGQTGRLMALAWEMRSPNYQDSLPEASFLLDHQTCTMDTENECDRPTPNLRTLVQSHAKPLDLWLINYEGQANLRREGCDYQRTERTDGYKAQHYTCP
ncbi:MAG: hypothetical protein VKL39_05090 [Leptolyngbyaceae bacterium]|nr:hypothetical protein [Leptolyngbyaceae bacterium]